MMVMCDLPEALKRASARGQNASSLRLAGKAVSGGGLVERQAGDVSKIFRVEGPQTRASDERARGDGQIRLSLARTTNAAIELGRKKRFRGTERPRVGRRQ